MDKIKGQLAGVAALLGVIAAIGGGFVKYGEITTKLEVLENASNFVTISPYFTNPPPIAAMTPSNAATPAS